MNYTLQLSCSGLPSAFDLSPSHDTLVVASPGCLTFFKLNGLGTPRHVIHYEQPQQVRQLKYQRQGGQLLSALRAGVVSLWEPNKSLRPLTGHIKSQAGWISDMAWSPSNANMLATSCDGGHVSIWDVRSPQWPSQQVIAGGVCSNVDWCPSNANLLSVVASSGSRLIVFDSRMVGGIITIASNSQASLGDDTPGPDGGSVSVSGNAGQSGSGSTTTVNTGSCDFITAIEIGDSSITHASWCGNPPSTSFFSSSTSAAVTSSLILGTASGRLEYWDIQTGDLGTVQSSQFANLGSQTGGALIDSESLLLATPMGRGAVICRRQDLNNDRDRRKVRSAVNSVDENGVVIRLQGCPRDSLLNVFSPPEQRAGRGQLEYGPSIELAQMSKSPILGMLWGAPGRMIPPAHGGLELLVLTESASLTAIRVPQDVIRKYCYSGGASKSDLAAIALEKTRSRENLTGPSESSAALRPPGATNATLIAPRFPLGSLKSNRDLDLLDDVGGVDANRKKKKSGKQASNVALVSPDRGGDRFWAGIRDEVLTLEDAVQRGQLSGLIIGRIDQYARQVTLEMEKARRNGTAIEEKEKESDRVVALILRYPARGIPSFTIRGLEGVEESASGGALSAELDAIARKYNASSDSGVANRPDSTYGENSFLLTVAHCFRDRCRQPFVSPAKLQREGKGRENGQDADDDDMDDGEEDDDEEDEEEGDERLDGKSFSSPTGKSKATSDVIDSMAYRVPSPACSGGRWSSTGVLLLFGGASIIQASVSSPNDRDSIDAAYPKSLGDMLIMERAREEAYAQQMQYLKHTTNADTQDEGSSDEDDDDDGKEDDDSESGSDNSLDSTDSDEGALLDNLARRKTPIGRNKGRAAASSSPSFGITSSGSGTGSGSGNNTSSGGASGRGALTGVGGGSSSMTFPSALLPVAHQGQTLESLGEDLDLIAKAEARTAGFRRTLPSRTSDERALWLAAAAAASSSGIASSSPFLLEFIPALPILPQLLAEQYNLGPLLSHDLSPLAATSLQDVRARANACRYNAEVVTKAIQEHNTSYFYSAFQAWSLLAVSLDLYAAAQENPDGLASEGGAILRWSENVLGSSLLRRIIMMLVESQEVQLLATCLCVLGGSAQTIALMQSSGQGNVTTVDNLDLLSLKRLLDRTLAYYADILCRWGALAKATEVEKHRHRDVQTKESDCVILSTGVSCLHCGVAAESNWCHECNDFSIACSLCEASVRHSIFFCANCGHGGHPVCLKEWFERSVECPTGCGCRCGALVDTGLGQTVDPNYFSSSDDESV